MSSRMSRLLCSVAIQLTFGLSRQASAPRIQCKRVFDVQTVGTRVSVRFRDPARFDRSIQQLQANHPNLPLFKKGTVPFMGDYIDVAAAMFEKTAVTQQNPGGWMFNTAPSDSVVFHATWTDDRDVRPPPSPHDWTNYTPRRVVLTPERASSIHRTCSAV